MKKEKSVRKIQLHHMIYSSCITIILLMIRYFNLMNVMWLLNNHLNSKTIWNLEYLMMYLIIVLFVNYGIILCKNITTINLKLFLLW